MGTFGSNLLNGLSGSIGGGAIGLIGSAIGAGVTASQNKKNRDFTREMFGKENAEYDRRYSQQRADYLADLENERQYNSATAQMQRLKDAGLNPNNAFGSGGQLAGNSSAAQLMGAASPGSPLSPSQFNVGSQISSGVIASSQLDIAREQNEIAHQNADTALFRAYAEAQLAASQSKESVSRTTLNQIEAKYRDAMLSGKVEQISSEIELNKNRSFNVLQDSITKMTLRDAQKSELLAKVNNLNATADLAIQNMQLVRAQTSESRSRKGLYDEEAQYTFVRREYQEWYNKLQGELESIIKSIQESNASLAEKEAANYAAKTYWQLANGTLQTIMYPLGEYLTHRGSGMAQGYTPVGTSSWNY